MSHLAGGTGGTGGSGTTNVTVNVNQDQGSGGTASGSAAASAAGSDPDSGAGGSSGRATADAGSEGDEGDSNDEVVAPPIGVTVPYLPDGATEKTIAGSKYYVLNDAWDQGVLERRKDHLYERGRLDGQVLIGETRRVTLATPVGARGDGRHRHPQRRFDS